MSYDPIKKQSSSGSLALGSLAAALMAQTSPTLASGSGSASTVTFIGANGASVSSSYLGSKNKNQK
jgi:hypothetical protein